MSKKFFKWILRGWIGLASVGAFATGMVAFSHSAKPVAAVNTNSIEGQFAPIPTLAPLPSIDSSNTSVQPLQVQQVQPLFRPSFRTRGS
jgi:hypothetical protein